MKKYIYILASFISVLILVGSPAAMALTVPAPADSGPGSGTTAPLAPLLITEVQPGSQASASEEFIELYNTTDSVIDLAAFSWQLQIASSSATDWSSPLRTVPLTGQLQPHAYYVAASQYTSNGQVVRYLPDIARVWFTAGLTASAGHVRITYQDKQRQADGQCVPVTTVVDEVEWSLAQGDIPATPSLDGRSPRITGKTSGVPASTSLQRGLAGTPAMYTDSDDDSTDFLAGGAPSPGQANTGVTTPGDPQPAVALPGDACTPAAAGGGGPSGGTGQETGSGTGQEGGLGTGDTGGDAAGEAANAGLQSPQVSELLPNPAPPQTDEANEFIELYNPNERPFDLHGYQLVAGITTTHSYNFPPGSSLAPGEYKAFYAADTGLSLSNSSGKVRLNDPTGGLLDESASYGAAKDGQAWALIDGVWQWTDAPTPNAANRALAAATPAVKAAATAKTTAATGKKPAAPKATPKTAAPKTKTASAKTKKAAAKAKTPPTIVANTAAAKSSLHPVVLATVVGLAVLYGAYEYRHDLANYYRRLREHRAHRRAYRAAVARRRDD